MRYVALLRGINVGGKNKVVMADLRAALAEIGFSDVETYINSGNVLLSSEGTEEIVGRSFENLLSERFRIETRVLIVPAARYRSIVAAVPANWRDDKEQKSDVLFLFPEDDSSGVLERIPPRDGVEDARYVPGAVLWNVSRDQQSRTGLQKVVGTKTYKNLTIRNVNTARKLAEMLNATD